MTITQQQQDRIASFISTRHIPSGLGTPEEACTIAAGNYALTGVLTDEVPECMSEVIGLWIIPTQDAMPDEMRNSKEWRELVPLAFGTGRKHEAERAAILMAWMWDVVLPELQPLADRHGYGAEWLAMTTEKTKETAQKVQKVVSSPLGAVAASAWMAADAMEKWAASAGMAAELKERGLKWAAWAWTEVEQKAEPKWYRVDPIRVLRDLIAVSEGARGFE